MAATSQVSCRNSRSVARPPRASASDCCRPGGSCREPPRFSQEDRKGRKARDENAFLFLEDQNQKYFPRKKAGRVEPATLLQTRGRQRVPQNSRLSPFRSPDLPVKKSRAHKVAWIRHRSFCDSGCGLAAPSCVDPCWAAVGQPPPKRWGNAAPLCSRHG